MLEQYPSTPHLAACMIHTAEERFHDIEGRYRHACSEILSRKTLSASCPTDLDRVSFALSIMGVLLTRSGKAVADLGCGTCMLSIAAAIMGAKFVWPCSPDQRRSEP